MILLKKLFLYSVFCICVLFCNQSNAQSAHENFTVESYYKVKWGSADEFINLWKKNHYPLDSAAQKHGDIISIKADKPRLHSGEDTRWDFRVTVVYKNSDAAFNHDLTNPYKKLLYTDLTKLSQEEKHRFELVIAHWDVMVDDIDLN